MRKKKKIGGGADDFLVFLGFFLLFLLFCVVKCKTKGFGSFGLWTGSTQFEMDWVVGKIGPFFGPVA